MSDMDLLIRLEEVEARVSSADEKITELVTRLEALEKANHEIIQRLEALEPQSKSTAFLVRRNDSREDESTKRLQPVCADQI